MAKRKRSGTEKETRKGLSICSVWVTDASGETRKDCCSCPYQDPNDPGGLNCGERLMYDAELLIEELKAKIQKLESEANTLRHELMLMEHERKGL